MNMNSYKCCTPGSPQLNNITSLSKLLTFIGKESKLQILCLLKENERCVCELLECCKMSQSLISHHLADLKKEGLVANRKEGRKSFYSLTKKGQEIIVKIFSIDLLI